MTVLRLKWIKAFSNMITVYICQCMSILIWTYLHGKQSKNRSYGPTLLKVKWSCSPVAGPFGENRNLHEDSYAGSSHTQQPEAVQNLIRYHPKASSCSQRSTGLKDLQGFLPLVTFAHGSHGGVITSARSTRIAACRPWIHPLYHPTSGSPHQSRIADESTPGPAMGHKRKGETGDGDLYTLYIRYIIMPNIERDSEYVRTRQNILNLCSKRSFFSNVVFCSPTSCHRLATPIALMIPLWQCRSGICCLQAFWYAKRKEKGPVFLRSKFQRS